MQPILDLMQTLPTFVYLIPGDRVRHRHGAGSDCDGDLCIPAPIRLTRLGISATPPALQEAGEAFGGTPRQKLWKVELPYALRQIMAGLNQTIMLSLSMVVSPRWSGRTALVPVVRALNSVNTELGFEAASSLWWSPSSLTGCCGSGVDDG